MNKAAIIIFLIIPLTIAAQEQINELEELANGYQNQGNQSLAAEFYSKAGYSYWNKGNKARAALSFRKAFDLFSALGNNKAAIVTGNNLGLVYLDLENYNEAYNAFSKVLNFARKSKNNIELFNALINTGTVAFELKSYNDAIAKANEALNIAKESNNLRSIAKCYSILAESNEKLGNSADAFKYFELYSSIDKKIKAQEMDEVKQMSAEEISKANEKKRITEIELKIKKGELKLTQDSLYVAERLAYERQMQVELRNEQLKQKEIQLRYELKLRRTLIFGIIITVLFLIIVGYMLRQKFIDNKTLRKQKEEITEQRNKLDVQNKKITDSIHYGLRIQQAMLPSMEEIQKKIDAFVIFKPKDIVSGDFYWFHEIQQNEIMYRFIAVVDCTGHGVPGAFMSMIGHRLLTEIVIEHQIYQPSQVLEEINNKLKKELHQDSKQTLDGMDIAFCRIAKNKGKYDEVVFAGAKRPLLIYKADKNKLEITEGDRKDIGGYRLDESKTFTDKTLEINTGDMLVLYSDGIIDQPNPKRERFGTPRFSSIITDNINEPLDKIKQSIENAFISFKSVEEQRDDITIIGLRLN